MKDLPGARLMMQEQNDDQREGKGLKKVRRRLFHDDASAGNSDPNSEGPDRTTQERENFQSLYDEELQKIRQQKKEQWNFDFEKGEPLPGRYQWTRLDADGNEIPNTTTKQLDDSKSNNSKT